MGTAGPKETNPESGRPWGLDFPVITIADMVRAQVMLIDHLGIVSFYKFAHWQRRLFLGFRGRMPGTDSLHDDWYETPNIHLCTIRDFVILCREQGIAIERGVVLDRKGRVRTMDTWAARTNLLGDQAVFLLSKSSPPAAGRGRADRVGPDARADTRGTLLGTGK